MAHKNKQWNELPFEFMWRILISHQSFFGKCHKMVGFYGGLISGLRSHTHHLKIKKRLSLIYLEIFLPSSYGQENHSFKVFDQLENICFLTPPSYFIGNQILKCHFYV